MTEKEFAAFAQKSAERHGLTPRQSELVREDVEKGLQRYLRERVEEVPYLKAPAPMRYGIDEVAPNNYVIFGKADSSPLVPWKYFCGGVSDRWTSHPAYATWFEGRDKALEKIEKLRQEEMRGGEE